ncbi:hypothetical protein [Amycolatopsis sp. GM8]|uniref:hypothetical protein n=1 Tax=Amycolatopsis sp. GM8 TaxID=2896530 RepID=UPI001F3C5466|nr:hypothetical protein [Amycolatopsis sp. GM8]
MKSYWLVTDGAGGSRIEALPLPYAYVGPTATDADRHRMPPPELAREVRAVRSIRSAGGGVAAGGTAVRRLLFLVSGSLTVATADMTAVLDPGDVLFVDDLASNKHTLTYRGDARALEVEVTDSWTPQGSVAPVLADDARRADADPLLREMYVADGKANFRSLPGFFEESSDTARPIQALSFVGLSPDSFGDWHTEKPISLVFVLAGGFELEVGGTGGTQVFRPGDVCVVRDHDGQGHRTRTRGETRFAALVLAPESVEG